MGTTFVDFQRLRTGMVDCAVDTFDWSCGSKRIIKDSTTGDLCTWCWSNASGSGTVELWTSQNNGRSWNKISSNASNASAPYPDLVFGVVQSSNGLVHGIAMYNNGTALVYYYVRYSLTITNSHVSGYANDMTPLALNMGTADATFDPRAVIDIATLSGAEVPVYAWQAAAGTGTAYVVYAGYITATSGTVSSTGLTGSGSNTQIFSKSIVTAIGNHNTMVQLSIEKTNNTLHILFSGFNSDYYVGAAANAEWDLIDYPYTISGGAWTAGSTQVIYTVPGGGADEPMIVCTYSTAGYAYVCYYTQAVGLVVGRYDSSGTWTAVWRTLSTLTGRAYFAAIATDGTTLYACYTAYDTNGATSTGAYLIHDGTTLNQSPDLTAAQAEGMYGSSGWSSGLVVMRGTPGDTLGQTRTGNQIATITAIAPSISPNLPVTKRRNVIGSGMNMGLNIKEWW